MNFQKNKIMKAHLLHRYQLMKRIILNQFLRLKKNKENMPINGEML